MTISFKNFIYGMTIFELYPTEDSSQKVPCLFRVGPKRFLEALADPEHTKVRYMYHNGNKMVYSADEKAEFTTKYSKPFFDAPAFLQERDIAHSYCDKDHYKWNRKLSKPFMPNSYLMGTYGICFHSVNWLDIEINHSKLYFFEDGLTLCGKQIQSIQWRSFDDADSASGKNLQPLIRKLLDEKNQFDAAKLYTAAENSSNTSLYALSVITTDSTFYLEGGLERTLSIDTKEEHFTYSLPLGISAQQITALMISLLDTEDHLALRSRLHQLLSEGKILLPRHPRQ